MAERVIQPGDWVAFYRGACIVIAEVRYRTKADTYPYHWHLMTESGSVDEQYVLEVRPKPGPTATEEPR